MKACALIVAGGSGLRMKKAVRKQYLLLKDKPILFHTLIPFISCKKIYEIFLVVPKDDIFYVQDKIIPFLCSSKSIHIVPGGKERQDSVFNGLCAIKKKPDFVVIHDGVRPFITKEMINRGLESAYEKGSVIFATKAFDTLKKAGNDRIIEKTLDRKKIWLAQTPQIFPYDIISDAHKMAKKQGLYGTDDASLVEMAGNKVHIIKGKRFNIKITTPEDMRLAQALLSVRNMDNPPFL